MKKLYEAWKKVAEKIGNFQVNIVFSLIYLLLFTPVGFFASRFQDFFNERKPPSWKKISDNTSNIAKLSGQ